MSNERTAIERLRALFEIADRDRAAASEMASRIRDYKYDLADAERELARVEKSGYRISADSAEEMNRRTEQAEKDAARRVETARAAVADLRAALLRYQAEHDRFAALSRESSGVARRCLEHLREHRLHIPIDLDNR
jgi:hypothetical protein